MPRKPKSNPQNQGKNRDRRPPEATQFKPGQSGNPGGRPKGQTLLKTIRELLYTRGEPDALEKIANAFIDAMSKGSFQHLKEFIDREEGKVPDRVANADGSNLGEMDYSKLSTEELTLYRALLLKAKSREPDGE